MHGPVQFSLCFGCVVLFVRGALTHLRKMLYSIGGRPISFVCLLAFLVRMVLLGSLLCGPSLVRALWNLIPFFGRVWYAGMCVTVRLLLRYMGHLRDLHFAYMCMCVWTIGLSDLCC